MIWYWPDPSVTVDRDFLDERRTRCFDGDAREHGSRRVFHDPCDRRLGIRRGWQQGQTQTHRTLLG